MLSLSGSRRTSEMAELLFSEVPLKKRKTETESADQSRPCRQVPFSLLSSTELLLQIPQNSNTSLPVWESVNAAHAQVQWSVTPYGITIQITPLTTQKAQSNDQPETQPSSLSETQLSTLPTSLPVPSIQPMPQMIHGVPLNLSTQIAWNTPNPYGLNLLPVLPYQTQATQSPPKPLPQSQTLPQLTPSCQSLSGPGAATHEVIDLPSVFYQLDAKTCYTQSSGSIYICDRFLTGHCRYKSNCKQHHTPLPFHWQLRRRDTQQWVDVSLSALVKLEKLYCDIGRETIKMQDETDMFSLHFDTMTVKNSVKYDEARRLTNRSNPARIPLLSTVWKIYWWNDYEWEPYKEEVSTLLLEKMREGRTSCRFFIGEQEYKVDFSTLTQRNLTTRFKRRVRLRPTFHSLFSLKSHLKTVSLGEPPRPFGQVLPSLSVDPLQEFSSWYPPVWTLSPDQGFSLVKVPPNAKAYQSVHCLFHSTMLETKTEIISIQQVQNVFQWDKYRRQKEHMQSRSTVERRSLERHLFHGTTEDCAKEISLTNFDPRVSGKNGVAYGQGTYFARHASYADAYAQASGEENCQHMFLAKVLVGRMSVGNTAFCRPPCLDPQTPGFERYDTCVNWLYNPSTFVVFDSCQCYPYYLIKYKALSDIVNIC
ncbi:hypothetical protein ANANG_G00143530 [Anguilla anguilla]|uniref:Poly [ADP-ribose] polymerase n=1 Tax=Anguilla anguilla TaxID=7936 RepID=A0A9D3RWK2_ANGAN|nr:hypothetical protein ANANG_G00143530 [Anguilla anguilla]